jgi:tyrosyl-tRNA synthetase
MPPPLSFLDELAWRGLIQQATDEPALRAHLASPDPAARRAYVGFDPTADSLTIGNLVGIMALARFQRAGHSPVALMGGGTGLIGDPSGKSAERQLNSEELVRENVKSIRRIFDRFLDFSPGKTRAVMPDNIDWLGKLGYLELLRDVGKHFSVNMMIQKDSVKSRLEGRDHGISYTEFSYMILQAYDFAHLHRAHAVTLQMGGSDQYGNIVVGMDLIKKMGGTGVPPASPSGSAPPAEAGGARCEPTKAQPSAPADGSAHPPQAFGLVWPLVTKADGGKFGKTESGAVWLSPHRTSPYAYYQFWLNAADADVARFLKIYTHLGREEIAALEHSLATDPGKREAQRALAHHATELLHGPTERERAQHAAQALFSGELNKLDEAMLDEVLASAPSTNHDKASLSAQGEGGAAGIPLVDLLAQTTLAKSKSEARTLLTQGSISVNGHKAAPDARVSLATLLHGRLIALRRGGKTWHITRWS